MLPLRDFLNEYVKRVKYDDKFVTAIRNYKLTWIQKSPEYIEFMGSNLLGVHKVRFSVIDEEMLFEDIFKVDGKDLQKKIYTIPGVNKNFKVQSNNVYIILTYAMHMVINSTSIKANKKTECLIDLYYIFAFKALTSLLSRYFANYAADPAIAKMVYEKMSNRFLIKKLGDWNSVFQYRAEDILEKGLHYKKLKTYNTDDVMKIIADMQGRIRDIVKNIYGLYMEIIGSGGKIVSTSSLEDTGEGELGNKGVTNSKTKYINYLRSSQLSEYDFVKDDLIKLVNTFTPYTNRNELITTLKYIATSVDVKDNSDDDFNYYTLTISFAYLNTRGITDNYNKNIIAVIKYMKNYWGSHNIKDTNAKRIKKIIVDIVMDATGIRTSNVVMSTTVSVLIYLFLRAIMVDNR